MGEYDSGIKQSMQSKLGSERVYNSAPPKGVQSHIESAMNNDHADLTAKHDTMKNGAKSGAAAAIKRRLGSNSLNLNK